MPSASSQIVAFPPFALDLRAGLLRRDRAAVNLRPKTFAVLVYLAQHPGELVTKQALLDAVWGDIAVTEDVVRLSVGELRTALGDERQAPRFIETVPRRGYRFVAEVGDVARDRPPLDEGSTGGVPPVGRQRELATVLEWLVAARAGRRQIAFISGEAGIGKTTLVDAVVRELARAGDHWQSARGQCVEHFGGGEPYLPVLDALADLCRGPDAPRVRTALSKTAPGWVLAILDAPVAGGGAAPHETTHEHTLHKLATTLEAVAAESPLVLVLEDVQWSDYATLDLLSVLAQRRERAPLAILCTLRPTDAIVSGHPVAGARRELIRKGLCREIMLDGLVAQDVAEYLARRFDGVGLPDELLPLLMERTEGNPFFVAVLIEDLLERNLLARRDGGWELHGGSEALRTSIPEGLRAVIEPRLDRLAHGERRLLESASILGLEFPAHAIAAIAAGDVELGDVEAVEELCDGLVRRQEILRAAGESAWPNGRWSARYAFRHALFRQVAYERIAPSTSRRLHQAAGECLEAGYGQRTPEVASELAAHFERSRDVARAIRYREEAAHHAGSRFAYREARLHLQAALDHLRALPRSPEHPQREMELQGSLGWTSVALFSWGDGDATRAFSRMHELAVELEQPAMQLRAMESLRSAHTMRAEYARARILCEETSALAARLGDDTAAATADTDLATTLLLLGEIERAQEHAERAIARLEAASVHGISTNLLLAATASQFGWIARSHAMGRAAIDGAETLGDPYFRAFARMHAAATCQVLGDIGRTRALAEDAIRLARECGFSALRTVTSMLLGACTAAEGRVDEGRAAAHAALEEYIASGQRITTTAYRILVAATHLMGGDVASAKAMLDAASAFAAETGERIYEPELHRLDGECLLAAGATRAGEVRAAECFERAMAIAAERRTPLFELRAATSLLRLRRTARARVVELLERFDAENDCADAQAARRALAARR